MTLLTWGSENSVGVQALDEEHLELFEVINALYVAVLSEHGREQTGVLLRRVLGCTRRHFSSEEAMLAAANYPELAEHSLKHQSLLAEVEELAARFEQDGLILNDQSLNFLHYWFNDHLQNDDLSYTAWLNTHGVC
jgi:hemerythrin-like metal-binding protein